MKKVKAGACRTPQTLRRERQDRQRHEHQEHAVARVAVDQPQQDRKEDVVLLLDRQRPGVKHRLHLGLIVEIARLPEEQDVRGEEQGRDHALRKVAEIERHQQERRRHAAGDDHGEQAGHDPPDAPLIEVEDREPVVRELGGQNAGDQVARNDEEHVDPDIAAAEHGPAGMKEQHRQHRQRAQTIDLGLILHPLQPSVVRQQDQSPGGTVQATKVLQTAVAMWRVRSACVGLPWHGLVG